MANISGSREERIFSISQWIGLNESPDGDTKLKTGEGSVVQNWKITRDNNLRRRGGYKMPQYLNGSTMTDLVLGEGEVKGIFSGTVNGEETVLAACDGHVYKLWDGIAWCKEEIGLIDTSNRITFFPFGGIVYILNGIEYYQYDGFNLTMVQGYRPLLFTALTPAGAQPSGGSMLEEANKLTGARRLWYSPDGTSTEFVIVETDIVSIDYVKDLATGELINPTTYTASVADHKVTFTTAPTAGINTIEIGYSAINTYREQVTRMRFAEMFSGSTDMRVFIYGDGSNEVFYSSIDYDGTPRADYFPDLNEIAVGDKNTPVTAVIRHLSALIVYKTDSTYSIAYGLIDLEDGSQEAAFYVTSINKALGNEPMGMVQLVLNSPYTIMGHDIYEWSAVSRYSSTISKDERTAKRVSDKIYSTIGNFDTENIFTYDDNIHQEYYVCNPAKAEALVWNYAVNAWYYYDHFPMNCACVFDGDILFGSTSGKIELFSDSYYSDNGEAFDSIWESGSMDFGRPYERKFSSEMWIVIKPESRGHVGVTARTDRKSDFDVKDTDSSLLDFWDIDFSDISFSVNRSPRTYRHRLKAKKFTYYKLRLESNDAETGATVLNANFRVRFTGFAK